MTLFADVLLYALYVMAYTSVVSMLSILCPFGSTLLFARTLLRGHKSLVGFEFEVDVPLGDAGAAGHIGQLGAGIAPLDEHVERGRDELLGPGVFATLPAGLGDTLRGDAGLRHGASSQLVTER